MPARAYGKRSYKRKTTKRVPRKYKKYSNLRKLTANTVYTFSRYGASVVQPCSTLTTQLVETWKLDDVSGYLEFLSLFDMFKIKYVEVSIQLVSNPDASALLNTAGANYTNWFPKIWYVRDYDDDGGYTLAQMKEVQGAKFRILKPNSIIKIRVSPKFLTQTYRTAITTGYAPRSGWLDCATAYNVPHYGLKFLVDTNGIDPNDSYPFYVSFEEKFVLDFKGAS